MDVMMIKLYKAHMRGRKSEAYARLHIDYEKTNEDEVRDLDFVRIFL
jgi:hypothetical protein